MKLTKENLKDSKIEELLIVIDMVNGFVKEGVLAAPNIIEIVPYQLKVIEEFYKRKNKGIVFIRDNHSKKSVEFNVYPKHCLEGTSETEIIEELKNYSTIEYKKNSTNFVFAPNFIEDLDKMKNLKKVHLIGCLSDVCVRIGALSLRTYFDQNNKNIEICVHEKGIDTYDSEEHNRKEVNFHSLKDMENHGIKVIK